jgi:GH24 family phage-related lysozyme (muramidase)
MTIIELAAKVIRLAEGCKLQSYWDPYGKCWTIGFGRAHGVTQGQTITYDQAVAFLAEDCAAILPLVSGRPLVEAAMLVSFGYNCGVGALRRVLSGDISVAHEEFWAVDQNLVFGESSGGRILTGLQARRELEAALIEASRL